jgi:hypothetical protein
MRWSATDVGDAPQIRHCRILTRLADGGRRAVEPDSQV